MEKYVIIEALIFVLIGAFNVYVPKEEQEEAEESGKIYLHFHFDIIWHMMAGVIISAISCLYFFHINENTKFCVSNYKNTVSALEAILLILSITIGWAIILAWAPIIGESINIQLIKKFFQKKYGISVIDGRNEF